MKIKQNHFNDYLQLLYKNKEDLHFITRIQVVDNMISFEGFSRLTEEEKEIFLEYTSYYWFKSDLEYNTLFDICYLVMENKLYQSKDYATFEEELDKLI